MENDKKARLVTLKSPQVRKNYPKITHEKGYMSAKLPIVLLRERNTRREGEKRREGRKKDIMRRIVKKQIR